ncbi:CsgG/HfaB family protein [bacterium]|nr:CsgG/HfaB family protein [bacterium]MCG2675943.1 CsgG/HfaB family protein [bacterium]
MKKLLLVIMVSIFCIVVLSCAPRIAVRKDYDFSKVKRVAVLPFEPAHSSMATLACDYFTTELMRSNMFEIVERSQLRKVLKEYEISEENFYDKSTFDKIAKIFGVDAVIVGSGISSYTSGNIISVRLIDIETGIVVWSGTSSRLKGLVKRLVKEMKAAQRYKEKVK